MNDVERINRLNAYGHVGYVRAVRAGNLKAWVRSNREEIDAYLSCKDRADALIGPAERWRNARGNFFVQKRADTAALYIERTLEALRVNLIGNDEWRQSLRDVLEWLE